MNGEPLPLMSQAEKASYADWLLRLVGRRKGPLPDRLRNAAAAIRSEWRFA